MDITNKATVIATLVLGWIILTACDTRAQEIEHGFATSGDVKLHYATAGEGPLLVMIHGFPDYWYTWRNQIPELAKRFKVVAVDQRGYNKSDQPEGVENYTLAILAEDIKNLVKHFGREKAIVVGHDWGGYVAWTCAMRYPDMVQRLVILNAPHPNGLRRELAHNQQQRENSQYARDFQAPDAASKLTADGLAQWVTDLQAKSEYVEAFERSSFEAMLNYYKANYPSTQTETAQNDSATPATSPASLPTIKCPVLMIHGLEDKALLPDALNDSWKWMDKELTIITVPGAGHFVQQDAAELVTQRISNWLR